MKFTVTIKHVITRHLLIEAENAMEAQGMALMHAESGPMTAAEMQVSAVEAATDLFEAMGGK